jgi:membrane associated rhomboid family serine protease
VQLIVITVVVYVVQLFVDQPSPGPQPLADWLKLTDQWYLRPWRAYELLTYGFVHSREDMWHILLNMYALWLFGTDVDERYGSREFRVFYLVAIVFAGLVWTASELPFGRAALVGASGGVVATLVLFALNFPHRQILLFFVLPMPMWVAACIFVGLDIVGAMQQSEASNVAFTAHLGGALFALVYYKLGWRLSNWLPRDLSLPNLQRQPKLRVHRPADDDEQENDIETRVDAILKKINDQGQASLTRAERKLLEQASRQYQQKRK